MFHGVCVLDIPGWSVWDTDGRSDPFWNGPEDESPGTGEEGNTPQVSYILSSLVIRMQ